MLDTNSAWIVVGVIVAALVIVFAIVSVRRRGRARDELRQRFGPEYDRAVDELGSPARADRELAARARRVEHMRFHDLTDADRVKFSSAWSRIQAEFVDDPAAAVAGANELIKEVMVARGYPADGFEQRAADLSVDHPEVVQHYRAARALSGPPAEGRVNTEELRQAVVHYRVLFADLLQVPSGASMREAHA